MTRMDERAKALHDEVKKFVEEEVRPRAEARPTREAWEAYNAGMSALHDLWGMFGGLALDIATEEAIAEAEKGGAS